MLEIKVKTTSSDQTKELGQLLGRYSTIPSSFCLRGDLGAGKTTLTKGIAIGCGITSVVNSPTFNICKIYQANRKLVHIDAYRLTKNSDDLGFEEEFDDALTIVEWPDQTDMELIHPNDITIERLDEDQRLITLSLDETYHPELVKEIEAWLH